MIKLFLKNLLIWTAVLGAGFYAQFLMWAGEISEANEMFFRLLTGTVRIPVFIGIVLVGMAALKTWGDSRPRKSD